MLPAALHKTSILISLEKKIEIFKFDGHFVFAPAAFETSLGVSADLLMKK